MKAGIEAFKEILEPAGLPELGPGPRPGVLPETEIIEILQPLLEARKLSHDQGVLIRALLLLWNDHSDAAHEIAQEIENPDGSFVHGIIHRREPDYGNAAYWFRRAGHHKSFGEFVKRVSELLDSKDQSALKTELLPGGSWDAFAFIHLCEKASKTAKNPQVGLLRQIQGLETEVLLEHLLNAGAEAI